MRQIVRIGLSGGLDSSVLLHVLAQLRAQDGFALSAVHVHHGLVPGARAWGAHCAAMCAELGVPCAVVDVSVDRADPAGLEAAARSARRAALLGAGGVVALAHHRDDQAETVLFRAVRGSGIKGLSAMRELQPDPRGFLWRPLLATSRAELEAYARLEGLAWIEDPSNAERYYARNYLRHEVMPQLTERFPGSAGCLARLARLAGEASELMDEIAAEDRERLRHGDSRRFNYSAALELSSARWRNLLRGLLVETVAALPDEDRLREAERQFRGDGARGGLRVVLGARALCVYRDQWWLDTVASSACTPERRPLAGLDPLRWAGAELCFRGVSGAGIARAALAGEVLHVDRRRGGERLALHAGGPSRSLKNLFQEASVPPWLRQSIPLVWIGDRLAWVAGVGVAAEFSCPAGVPGVLPDWAGLG